MSQIAALLRSKRELATAPPDEELRSIVQDALRFAEHHRRLGISEMLTGPLPGHVDYASAGVWIDQAMHHLDESIPLGQRARTEAALIALLIGTERLAAWAQASGYSVPLVTVTIS